MTQGGWMRTTRRRRWFGAGLWLWVSLCVLLSGQPGRQLHAQGGDDPPPAGTTVHVVQRGETLFRIAMQYGTTVEAIAEANGILDPRYIGVGQRLLIPNAQVNAAGTVTQHTVEPGQTLRTLAAQYNAPPDAIAAANYITHPALLYVGQTITVPLAGSPAADVAAPTAARTLYAVRPNDNLARLALQNGIPLHQLAALNDSALFVPLFAGQRIWLPAAESAAPPADLPDTIRSYRLAPTRAVQGRTISLSVTTHSAATLTGDFNGQPLQIVTQNGSEHTALLGIHAFMAEGIYPLTLTVTDAAGQQTTWTVRLKVDVGGYGAETIAVGADQQALLNTDVTEPEWQHVALLMSGFTAQRYFDGLMGLPSSGAITSAFGTRRSYNDGLLSSFHTGTDFGGAPGSPILAPAAGVVVLAEALPVRGNATIIDHGWGVVTGYWHQAEIYVAVGDVVSAGQIIGAVGTTGRSTGPHLHWEMWVSGVEVDPMQWVQQIFP